MMQKTKLIHEVHDLWPATLIEVGGMSRRHPFVWLMQRAENSAYRHSDLVVSLASHAKEYMVVHGLKERAFVHINNGIVRDDWERPQEIPKAHRTVLAELKKDNKFIVGYFGGHALSNALDVLIEAAIRSQEDERVQFVLVGDGVEKERLMHKARKAGVSNLIFLDAVPKLAIPRLVEYFDCCYVGVKDSPLYRFGIAMNKIFDVMMAGKPMLYAVNAPNQFAEQYQCGLTIEAGNPDAIVEGIQTLQGMSEAERIQMGKNGREAVLKNYEYSVLAKKFLDLMK